MVEVYRDLLIIICICLLGWGLIRIERVYQYPFFMGSMFVSFLLPQVFALIKNPGLLTQDALERVLLMSCFCAAACWIGYTIKPNTKVLKKLNIIIDQRKLFRVGIVLMFQGYLFNFLLSITTIQRSESGTWTGPATIYLFLAQVINIAFGIFLLKTLNSPKIINIILTIIAGWPLVQPIFVGRRQPTMTFIIIVGLSFWLAWRYVPPRMLVITAVVLLIFIIPVVGELRSRFWDLVFSGKWEKILSSSQGAFETQQKGDILELRNAAFIADATEKMGLYGYGSGWWDSIVFQYVPGQIVGYDFKQSLQFNLITREELENLYGYTIPSGTTITGVGDSFAEFGYFGCFSFGLIAYFFKHLWISAVYKKSIFSSLLYMGLVSPAMVGLTHGIGRFWQEAIFQVFFVSLAVYYSRVKYKYYAINS
ncbi:MAG: hypothetical protein V7L22_20590 [Nostoc sp.]|uniref:hypothetical protein n=1 Tax=Nostoc sp. TaxID=1180 RepID=UPI002FF81C58